VRGHDIRNANSPLTLLSTRSSRPVFAVSNNASHRPNQAAIDRIGPKRQRHLGTWRCQTQHGEIVFQCPGIEAIRNFDARDECKPTGDGGFFEIRTKEHLEARQRLAVHTMGGGDDNPRGNEDPRANHPSQHGIAALT
jgi:hypothetical protein